MSEPTAVETPAYPAGEAPVIAERGPAASTRCATRATGGCPGCPSRARWSCSASPATCRARSCCRRSTTWPTAACCRPTSCCSASPAATGATATSRTWPRRRPRSTPARRGARRSGSGSTATSSSSRARSTTTTPSTSSTATLDELCATPRHPGQRRVLPVDPAGDVRRGARPDAAHRHGRQRQARSGWRRVVVEKPFGHDLRERDRAEQPGRLGLHRAGRLPDRPLPRQGDRPEHHGAALRQPDVRADLEQQLRRLGADHDGRGRRHRRPGRRSTTPPAPPATCCRTTCCSCSR